LTSSGACSSSFFLVFLFLLVLIFFLFLFLSLFLLYSYGFLLFLFLLYSYGSGPGMAMEPRCAGFLERVQDKEDDWRSLERRLAVPAARRGHRHQWAGRPRPAKFILVLICSINLCMNK